MERGNPVSGSNSSRHAANAISLLGQNNSICLCCTTATCQSAFGSGWTRSWLHVLRFVQNRSAAPYHNLVPSPIILPLNPLFSLRSSCIILLRHAAIATSTGYWLLHAQAKAHARFASLKRETSFGQGQRKPRLTRASMRWPATCTGLRAVAQTQCASGAQHFGSL
jgi:hypothetical protein